MTKSTGVGRHPPSQRKHGASWVNGRATAEYNAWTSMKWRCGNPHAQQYPNYGGRGITVCSEWLDSFERFLADMGLRPTPGHSLERVDNNAGYSATNCKWATKKEQSVNRRTTHFVVVDGRRMPLSQAFDLAEVSRATVNRRLSRGWPIEKAMRR